MDAKKFVDKDGNSVWTKETTDGRTQTSVCVETTVESIDFNTGYINEEKALMWIKGTNTETVVKQQASVIAMINKGTLATYRAFSKTPFYEGQAEDINPTTEVALGRYSQVRLCPAEKRAELHRQFVVVEEVAKEETPKVAQ
jgi:hypothetical protein